jgi:hypothetical protein
MKTTIRSFAFAALLASASAAHAGERAWMARDGLHVDATPTTPVPFAAVRGWQPSFTFTVPPGTVSLFFHYPCPAAFPIVHNGAFAFLASNGNQTQVVYLQYNGPRQDEHPEGFGEWGWHFFWPNGSPNPTGIQFQPECYATQ